MIFEQMFAQVKEPEVVKAAIIGAGYFSTPMISQSRVVPRYAIPALADTDVEAAVTAFRLAGVTDDQIVICDSAPRALRAMESGHRVVVQDAALLMDLPLDVIVTAVRVPDAAAHNADLAIRSGKHVVMVDKECDSVVGPILKHLADKQGVVFTTDFGDQPGVLMGLVSWARSLGLEVLCAGNMRAYRWDHSCSTVSRGAERAVQVREEDQWALGPIPKGQTSRYVAARNRLFDPFSVDEECGDPICHHVVSANGTGLLPDTPVAHRPAIVDLRELPEILCPAKDGGILQTRGAIEEAYLVSPDAYTADHTGGVFVVLRCEDAFSRERLAHGTIANREGTAMMAYRSYLLAGFEANLSVMCAGLLKIGATREVLPKVDMAARAARDFRAGEAIAAAPGTLGWDHSIRAFMIPGTPLAKDNPVPFFLLDGVRLTKDVPAGTVITLDMVEQPKGSAIWSLRAQQDGVFFA
ncbi:MAG: hypothetical protein ACYC4R_00510 [Anaerolineae bacterium]